MFLVRVYIDPRHGNHVRFRRVEVPTGDELTKLTHTIAHRVGRYLERRGLLERDTGNSYLTAQAVDASDDNATSVSTAILPAYRASPAMGLFD